MKTLITILLMLFATSLAVSQEGHKEGQLPAVDTKVANSLITNIESYYYKQRNVRPLSFQVTPQVVYHNGNTLFGSGIGVNYNEMVSIAYFHSRDYDFSETIMDNRWAGIYVATVFPLLKTMDIGPVVRFNTFNQEWQKLYVGVEFRVDLGWNTKLGIEHGRGVDEATSVKLIWNLY